MARVEQRFVEVLCLAALLVGIGIVLLCVAGCGGPEPVGPPSLVSVSQLDDVIAKAQAEKAALVAKGEVEKADAVKQSRQEIVNKAAGGWEWAAKLLMLVSTGLCIAGIFWHRALGWCFAAGAASLGCWVVDYAIVQRGVLYFEAITWTAAIGLVVVVLLTLWGHRRWIEPLLNRDIDGDGKIGEASAIPSGDTITMQLVGHAGFRPDAPPPSTITIHTPAT